MSPLVLVVGEVGDAEDDQLGIDPRQLAPGISPPANQSQRRKSRRLRASVVKTCGGLPPAASPITRMIAALTSPMSSRLPGAMRGGPVMPPPYPGAPDISGAWPTRPLLVVDAPSMLFRAFYALPKTITGPDDQPVNALLGTANLILREVELHKPRAVVLCFGPDAAAYRTELYPAYHAERDEAMPDELPGPVRGGRPPSSRPSAGPSRRAPTSRPTTCSARWPAARRRRAARR